MTDKSLSANHRYGRSLAANGPFGLYESYLKLLLVAACLPEGLSLFVGDFRLPPVRLFLMALLIPATTRSTGEDGSRSVLLPSDVIFACAGIWMIIAGVVTDGFAAGMKGGGALSLEFTGTYFVFRRLLKASNGSVRLVRFACGLMVLVTALALLDPLTNHLFVHDFVNHLTGYSRSIDYNGEAITRNGQVRAMGPLDHSILFGSACAWFAIIALCTFRFSRFSISISIALLIGIWFSQSRGSLAAFFLGLGLVASHFTLTRFRDKWKILIAVIVLYVLLVFIISKSPASTLLRFGGIDPEAGWYRELVWGSAGPLVLQSPIFGLGLSDDNWDWRSFDLVGPTVDSLWLRAAMLFGIPGSLLIFLALISPFWSGTHRWITPTFLSKSASFLWLLGSSYRWPSFWDLQCIFGELVGFFSAFSLQFVQILLRQLLKM